MERPDDSLGRFRTDHVFSDLESNELLPTLRLAIASTASPSAATWAAGFFTLDFLLLLGAVTFALYPLTASPKVSSGGVAAISCLCGEGDFSDIFDVFPLHWWHRVFGSSLVWAGHCCRLSDSFHVCPVFALGTPAVHIEWSCESGFVSENCVDGVALKIFEFGFAILETRQDDSGSFPSL